MEEDEEKGRRWIQRAPADISEESYKCGPNIDKRAATPQPRPAQVLMDPGMPDVIAAHSRSNLHTPQSEPSL